VNRSLGALLSLAMALAFLSFGTAAAALPQETVQAPPQPSIRKGAPGNDIFSGTVSELTADSVTVVRKTPARDAGASRFLLDAQTKVEGKLRLKASVTVRYQADDDGRLHALHIIVR
jgi:hypothetical protein